MKSRWENAEGCPRNLLGNRSSPLPSLCDSSSTSSQCSFNYPSQYDDSSPCYHSPGTRSPKILDVRHILKSNELPTVSSYGSILLLKSGISRSTKPKFVGTGSTNSSIRLLGMMLSSTTPTSFPWFLDQCILSVGDAVLEYGH